MPDHFATPNFESPNSRLGEAVETNYEDNISLSSRGVYINSSCNVPESQKRVSGPRIRLQTHRVTVETYFLWVPVTSSRLAQPMQPPVSRRTPPFRSFRLHKAAAMSLILLAQLFTSTASTHSSTSTPALISTLYASINRVSRGTEG